MMQSPAKKKAPAATWANTRYIHEFGHAFAQKLLGAERINDSIRQAYRLHMKDPVENQLHFFRSNWRSNVRFPWQIPKSSVACDVGQEKGEIAAETLFLDITFDFMLFPTEIVTEGRTYCCHVLKEEEFLGEDTADDQGGEAAEDFNSIAMAVAIRVGALLAISSPHCGSGPGGEVRVGKNEGDRGDGYHYYYQRGDNALTVSDLDDHCRSIDIVLEEMKPADVACIMGSAFLDVGWAGGGKPLHVMGKSESTCTIANSLTTIDTHGMDEQKRKHSNRWNVKVHHRALEADGFLPLSSNGRTMGEPIGSFMLDMILLQTNANNDGVCVSVPKTEALLLWKKIDPSLVRAVEKPVEPSPQKMSPKRKVATMTNLYAQQSPPKEKDAQEEKCSKTKTITRRPPKPQQTALFARGKKTTLGGSRRKKPKFTLGPA